MVMRKRVTRREQQLAVIRLSIAMPCLIHGMRGDYAKQTVRMFKDSVNARIVDK